VLPSTDFLESLGIDLIDKHDSKTSKRNRKQSCPFCHNSYPSLRLKAHLLFEHKKEITEKGYTEPHEVFAEPPDDAIGFIIGYCQKMKVGENYKIIDDLTLKCLRAELRIPGVDYLAKGDNYFRVDGENHQYMARLLAAEKMKKYLVLEHSRWGGGIT